MKRTGRMLGLLGLAWLLVGCGRPVAKQADGGATAAEGHTTAKDEGPGVLLCEDALQAVLLIGPCSLPPGHDAPLVCLTGVAAGAANTLLRTVDGGATWRRVLPRDPKGPDFAALFFATPSNGWAVSRSALLYTGDAGEHWVSAARLPGNFYYYGPASTTRHAFFQMQPPGCGARVQRTTDGGRNWQPLDGSLPRNDFEALFFLDDQHGWVVGRGGHTACTVDGGATWQAVETPGGGDLEQVQFVTAECGWALPRRDHRGGPWATRDGGRSWQPQGAGVDPADSLCDMQFLDAQTGYLLVNRGSDCSALLKSSDGGATWRESDTCPPDATALCVASPGVACAVGSSGRFYRLRP